MTKATMNAAIEQWQTFCDDLRTSGSEILRSAEGMDDHSQAEGLRYLTRLLRSGIEKFVEYSDPKDPFLANVYNDRLKWGLDNPDSLYAMGAINGETIYEIHGNIGTVHYFNFTSAIMSVDAKYQITGVLDGVNVKSDQAGNFKIIMGGPEQPSNWLPLDPQSNSILVRQTFVDRSKETELSFKIQAITDDAPHPITMDQSIARLKQTGGFFARTGQTFVKLTESIGREVNRLPLVDQELMLSLGGDPNYAYFWGGFQIKSGEALLVHFPEVPETDTWSLCLYNFWLESLDFTKALINLNKHLAVKNPDGSLTIVISDTDPGTANWLNTLGHTRGHIMSRWVNPDKIILPLTQVVSLDETDLASKMQKWVSE